MVPQHEKLTGSQIMCGTLKCSHVNIRGYTINEIIMIIPWKPQRPVHNHICYIWTNLLDHFSYIQHYDTTQQVCDPSKLF